MFTLDQIDEIHARLGSRETLADYVRALRSIGVTRYDSFVRDGHSEFVDAAGETVVTPAAHAPLDINEVIDVDAARLHLDRHGQGETGYLDMSVGLAASGIERWTVDNGGDDRGLPRRSGQRPYRGNDHMNRDVRAHDAASGGRCTRRDTARPQSAC